MAAEKIVQEAPESIAALASPERIAPDDWAELRGLTQAYRQQQQQAAQMQEAAMKTLGALEYVGQRLRAAYGIGERDEIAEDGAIRRAPGGAA